MNNFINYSLQSAICLAVFFLFYHFFLRKQRNFDYNRYFLIFAPILALILPLIKVPFTQDASSSSLALVYQLPVVVAEVTTIVEPNEAIRFPWQFSAVVVYVFGAAIFFVKLLLRLRKLVRLIRGEEKRYIGKHRVVFTHGQFPTFVFLNYLFWDESRQLSESESSYILRHEETHISQRHSLDVLLIEILAVVFWFNPLIRIYKKAIQENHEFIADSNAYKNDSKVAYTKLILKQLYQEITLPVAQFFGKSLVERRVDMIRNGRSNSLTRPLLSLPLIALMFFTFSCQEEYLEKPKVSNSYNAEIIAPEPFRTMIADLQNTDDSKRYYFQFTQDIEIELLKADENPNYSIEYHSPIDEKTLHEHFKTQSQRFNGTVKVTYPKFKRQLTGFIVGFSSDPNAPEPEDADYNIYDSANEPPRPWKGFHHIYERITENLATERKSPDDHGEVWVEFVVTRMGGIINSQIDFENSDELPYPAYGDAIRAVNSTRGLWRPGREGSSLKNVRMRLMVKL